VWAALYLLFFVGALVGTWFFVFGLFPDSPTLPGISCYPQHARDQAADAGSTVHHASHESLSYRVNEHDPRAADSFAPEHPQGPASFSRVVVIVIDALRADFVFDLESSTFDPHQHPMPYLRSLIEKHRAIPFVSRAAIPTVTMPRIKVPTPTPTPTPALAHSLALMPPDTGDDDRLAAAVLGLH